MAVMTVLVIAVACSFGSSHRRSLLHALVGGSIVISTAFLVSNRKLFTPLGLDLAHEPTELAFQRCLVQAP